MRALTIFAVFVAWASPCTFSQEVNIEKLRAAAEQGNAKAQYAIGYMYRFGKGVPQDYEYAFKWYQMAAEQGLPDAQSGLDGLRDRTRPGRKPALSAEFLRKIDRETPPALELHLIVDNYSTHKHEQVKKWLAKHPRFHFHFIPTSSSWLNLVERWFRELTQKRIRRGVFRSVPELEAAIHEYLEASNQAPKPFVWTAPAQDILAKVERAAKTHAIVQNR